MLEFLGSIGDTNKIRNFIDSKAELKVTFNLGNCFAYNNVNIISGCSTMDRTVLLNRLIEMCPAKYLPIIINIHHHFEYFHNLDVDDLRITSILKYFTVNILNETNEYFLHLLGNEMKMIIFLQDFELISIELENKIVKILQLLLKEGFAFFVTTSINKIEDLELKFKSFSRLITPWSKQNWSGFLIRYYTTRIINKSCMIEKFVTELLSRTNPILQAWDEDYFGSPFAICRVAELYLEECDIYCNREGNVEEAFEINVNISILIEDFLNRKIKCLQDKSDELTILEYHKYFAIKSIFSRDVPNMQIKNLTAEYKAMSDSIGVIDRFLTDDSPVFVHPSLANYFAALYISENFHQEFVRKLFDELFQNPAYDEVRKMVDRFLSVECSLHRALLNDDKKQFKELLNDETELFKVDKGGRNILHLAMSWGKRHMLSELHELKTLSYFFVLYATLNELVTKLTKSCRKPEGCEWFLKLILLKTDTFITEKEVVFSANPFEYGQKVFALESINVYLEALLHKMGSFAEIKSTFNNFCSDLVQINEMLVIASLYDYSNLVAGVFQCNPGFSPSINISFRKRNFNVSPLHFAAINKSHKVITTLIANVVNVDVIESLRKQTALQIAVSCGNSSTVKLLIERGANVNLFCKNRTALLMASECGNYETVKYLVDSGCDINLTYCELTSLMYASQNGHYEIVQYLIKKGSNVNNTTTSGDNALSGSSKNGHLEIVKFLIENGCNVNQINSKEKTTAVTLASRGGHYEIVRLLIENGSDINQSGYGWETSLMMASKNGYIEVVKLLIENGADVNYNGDSENSAVGLASSYGHTEIVKFLIHKGANINSSDCSTSALMLASASGHLETVKLLIDNGSNINQIDSYNYTALMNASNIGKLDVVKILVENGANVNHLNNDNESALWLSIYIDSIEVVKFLIEHGADINLVNNDGDTLLKYAINSVSLRCVNFLRKHGARK